MPLQHVIPKKVINSYINICLYFLYIWITQFCCPPLIVITYFPLFFEEISSLHSTTNIKNEIKKSSYLPSNLSLNTPIELPPHSGTSYDSLSNNSLIHPVHSNNNNTETQSHMENIHIGSSSSSHCKSPPTPPPRKFIRDQHYIKEKRRNESHNMEVSTHEKSINIESKDLDENRKEFDDAFENLVGKYKLLSLLFL